MDETISYESFPDGAEDIHFIPTSDLYFEVQFDWLPWDGEGGEVEPQLYVGLVYRDDSGELSYEGGGEYLSLTSARALRDFLVKHVK